jgi:hypothetical protein
LRASAREHTPDSVTVERKDAGRESDDVVGAAVPADEELDGQEGDGEGDGEGEGGEVAEPSPDPDATADPPPQVAELAAACVRFVAARYGTMLDFQPETLSLVDQWLRDARAELKTRPEAADVVQSAAGAYLGEVIRRAFGARWFADGDPAGWRLYLSTVYCAFNPIGMAREALFLEPAEGWQAHFELDPGEEESIEARLAALPPVDEDDYYAPSTRFDVVSIVFEALREGMRARGLGDVRFTPDDYA